MEYYSGIKKKEILPSVALWMDLETIMLSEISQSEKDKQVPYGLTHVESNKQNHNFLDPHLDLNCVSSLQCGSCLHLVIIHSFFVTCLFSCIFNSDHKQHLGKSLK